MRCAVHWFFSSAFGCLDQLPFAVRSFQPGPSCLQDMLPWLESCTSDLGCVHQPRRPAKIRSVSLSSNATSRSARTSDGPNEVFFGHANITWRRCRPKSIASMETDVARNITKHFRVGTARTPEKTSPVFAPVPVKGVDQHATAADACEACGTDLFDSKKACCSAAQSCCQRSRHLIPPIFSLPALKLHSPPTFDRLDLNDSSFGRGEQTPERPCPSLLSSAKPH